MTDIQKYKVLDLREKGLSYSEIAKRINVSINTVKSFCRRNNLKESKKEKSKARCEYCNAEIHQNPLRKKKRFCSDKCRSLRWNENKNLINKKAFYECVCLNCGKSFSSYGNKNRKYCCHACYIKDRFGGTNYES